MSWRSRHDPDDRRRVPPAPSPAAALDDPATLAGRAVIGFRNDDGSVNEAAVDRLLTEAAITAQSKADERDAAHAAFHGHPLRYRRVERRRGYRGSTVCLDCYYGKEWR